jgi:exodeoxyribonuclease VII small subunit
MATATSTPTYREAMGELQNIVDRLRDTEDIDVDDLVTDVARAKELITFCGGKIKRADAAIQTIVQELQADGTAKTADAEEEPAASETVQPVQAEDIPF